MIADKKASRSIVLLIALSLALLIGWHVSYVHYIRSWMNCGASILFYPILKVHVLCCMPFKTIAQSIAMAKNAQQHIYQLKQENNELLAALIKAQGMQDFVDNTRHLTAFEKRYKSAEKYICHIISKQFSEHAHMMIIDQGSSQGIQKDMIAVYNNCLVGRVVEVYPWYSYVRLITDKQSKIAAFCARTKTKGVLEGINDTTKLTLNHVSHLDVVEKDELVLSNGEGLVFPRGFGLGRIKFVALNHVDYEIMLEPLLDFSTLGYCYVLQKGKDT